MAAPQASPTFGQYRIGLVPQPGTATGALLTDSGWSSGLTINPSTGNLTVAGNLNITSGQLQLNGVNQFQSGTFTGTLTGVSGTVTGTCHYTISGNICTVSLGNGANILGTSNAATFTVTGLPAACQPAVQNPVCPCVVIDNSVACEAFASVSPGSGTITFYKAVVSGSSVGISASGFTSTGQKGLNSTMFKYSLQ